MLIGKMAEMELALAKAKPLIQDFLVTTKRAEWIEIMDSRGDAHALRLFVRNSTRAVNGIRVDNVFDLATIGMLHQGQGTLTGLLDWLEPLMLEYQRPGLLVECIQEPRLLAYLSGRGYVLQNVTRVEQFEAPNMILMAETIEAKIAASHSVEQ